MRPLSENGIAVNYDYVWSATSEDPILEHQKTQTQHNLEDEYEKVAYIQTNGYI